MQIELINIGEIRFGPSFYKVEINGIEFKNRIFGYEIFNNKECKYIVLQEWLTIDYSKGPITRPLIIDKEHCKFATLSDGKKGFSSNFNICDEVLFYDQVNLGTGLNRHFDCELLLLNFEDLPQLK